MPSEKETVSQRKALRGIIFGILFTILGILGIFNNEELLGIMIPFGIGATLYYSVLFIKRRGQKNTRRKIFVASLTILLTLSMISVMPWRVYASSQTYWEAPLPHEDTLVDKTLLAYNHETYGEVALSANLYEINKDYPQSGQYEFPIAVVALPTLDIAWDTMYHTEVCNGSTSLRIL
ncbi:MAG: hypothetical protein ACUVRA_00140 [Candidatus Bathyarchaeaceae archaeon]